MDSKRLENTHYSYSDDKKINIRYNIPLINYKGTLNDTIYNVTSNLINILQTKIISKHTDCDYYIHGDINDHLPSPFSNSNTIKFIIPNILYEIITNDRDEYTLKIRFFPNSKKFDFFDYNKYPTYSVEIINLNK
tara:strand:+ start:2711 stop:3115 length:405 start_codon:yes stop_codon:yes gene_type:complete